MIIHVPTEIDEFQTFKCFIIDEKSCQVFPRFMIGMVPTRSYFQFLYGSIELQTTSKFPKVNGWNISQVTMQYNIRQLSVPTDGRPQLFPTILIVIFNLQRCKGGIVRLNLAHRFITFSLSLGFPLFILLVYAVVVVQLVGPPSMMLPFVENFLFPPSGISLPLPDS